MDADFERVQNERLPTLYEVLIQKTVAPVDLWSFYTYLSQFPFAINYLDFWVDLMAHIRLCKDYVKLVRESAMIERRTNGTQNEKIEQPGNGEHIIDDNSNNSNSEDDDNRSVTTSVLLNALLEDGRIDLENQQDMNNFIQGDINNNNNTNNAYSPKIADLIEGWKRHSDGDNEALNIDNPNLAILMDEVLKKHPDGLPLPHITVNELQSNVEHICNTYLLSPTESQRYLSNIPDDIRLHILREVMENKKFTPEIFDQLKMLTYQFLEVDCFPKFLSRVALHNIHDEVSDWRFHQNNDETQVTEQKRTIQRTNKNNNINSLSYQGSRSPFSNYTSLSRTIFGMIWLGIGFWIGYVLIFLKYSRAIRVTTVVPFTIGCYMIICGMYEVDIIYSWFGLTQRLMFKDNDFDNFNVKKGDDVTKEDLDLEQGRKHNFKNIPFIFALLGGRSRLLRVEHPFIKALLFKRGLWCCMLVFISTACFTIIFSCVPGYRL